MESKFPRPFRSPSQRHRQLDRRAGLYERPLRRRFVVLIQLIYSEAMLNQTGLRVQ
jgi:hypothetical protein